MFDILNFTTASSLANSGTLTVGYPTGRTKGDYDTWNGKQHVLELNGNQYTSPGNFTLAFNANASSITLTNVNMGTIPANTAAILQIDRPTPDQLSPGSADLSASLGDKMYSIKPYLVALGSPNALATNGIGASQTVTVSSAPVAALLNGTGTDVTANADGSVTLNTPRNVTAAWTNTAIATVTGFDVFNQPMTEVSGSGTSLTGKKAFKKVTAVTFSATVTSATIGYGDVLGLPVAVINASQVLSEIRNGLKVSAGAPARTRLYWTLNQVDLLAGSTNSAQIVAPFSGTVVQVGTVVRKAITTGGTITFQDGSTAFVGGAITIANSAAQGAKQDVVPTAGDASLVITKGDVLQVVPASFATAGEVDGYIDIVPAENALLEGTLAVAITAVATTSTGDVRGTYKPSIATDGTTSYHLLLGLADYNNTGVTQK